MPSSADPILLSFPAHSENSGTVFQKPDTGVQSVLPSELSVCVSCALAMKFTPDQETGATLSESTMPRDGYASGILPARARRGGCFLVY